MLVNNSVIKNNVRGGKIDTGLGSLNKKGIVSETLKSTRTTAKKQMKGSNKPIKEIDFEEMDRLD